MRLQRMQRSGNEIDKIAVYGGVLNVYLFDDRKTHNRDAYNLRFNPFGYKMKTPSDLFAIAKYLPFTLSNKKTYKTLFIIK